MVVMYVVAPEIEVVSSVAVGVVVVKVVVPEVRVLVSVGAVVVVVKVPNSVVV